MEDDVLDNKFTYPVTQKDLFFNTIAKKFSSMVTKTFSEFKYVNVLTYRICQPLPPKASMLPLRTQEVEKQHLPGFAVKSSFSLSNVSGEVRIYDLLFDLEIPWGSITTSSSWLLFWREYTTQEWVSYAWLDNLFIPTTILFSLQMLLLLR